MITKPRTDRAPTPHVTAVGSNSTRDTLSPLRIIIIIILLYIAYRLITAGRRKARSVKDAKKKSSRQMPVSDTLEEDPICKKLVPSRQAVTMRLHGNTYYFCSQECCDIFRKSQGEQE